MKWEEIEKKFGQYVNSKENAPINKYSDDFHPFKIWDRIRRRIVPERSVTRYWWAAAVIVSAVMITAFYSSSCAERYCGLCAC